MRFRTAVLASLCFLLAFPLFAQKTSGVLTGSVTTEGAPLPGVTVTATSPSLQGSRTTVTNTNGDYVFPSLPPGRYNVTFELAGMSPVTRTVQVNLAQTARTSAELTVATVAEAITVTAETPSTLETSDVSANFSAKTIDELPINRTITSITALAPGVSTEGPNDQIMISGAPSYENLYIVNGAVVNDNIRGQPHSVYIEDAIEESTVLTGNISAEFGRFTGGVVNTITKSGGNEFSGSIRDSISNDSWTNKTPYAGEADPLDEINQVFEATLGGRIIRDRLWFFGAGRLSELEFSNETRGTNIPYTTTDEDERIELKLTGQITPNHSMVASYLDRERKQDGRGFGSITDLRSLDDRTLPESIAAINYSGIFASNVLFEAMYSERDFAFVGSGADSRDRIQGTIIRDNGTGRRAWSPTFCGVCGDKTRNNEYLQLKGSYFLSTDAIGSHSLVVGYEDFAELRNENNDQGGSGFRVWGNFRYVGQDTFIHVEPGAGGANSVLQYWPVLNLSQGSDATTRSLFINDKWDFNDKLSFNIGARYDTNDAVDQSGAETSNDSAISPRLSATYDLFGDGRHQIIVGYNEYAANIDNGINDEASNAGSPAVFVWNYGGPEINAPGTPDSQLIPTDVALQMVFDWFDSIGGVNNQSELIFTRLPGVSTQLAGELKSPTMSEYSVGYGVQLGSRAFLRADYISRDWSDFYTSTRNLSTGTVTNDLGQMFDLTLVGNNDAGLSRTYDAIQLQGNWRALDRLQVGGNYTWSELRGNAQTEAGNSATDTLSAQDHLPEYLDMAWNNPDRFLPGDVRHRANIWVSYDLPTPIGNFNFSALERYHSGYPYYAVGSISLSRISNPGYLSPPTSASYYVEGDKDYRTESVTRTDLGVNYSLPIMGVNLFVQADVLNLFDEDAIEDPSSIRTTVYTSRNSACKKADGTRCDAFNPKTTTPVEGVHYVKHSSFGEPTSPNAYQLPLTYRFSVGFRF